MTTLEILDSDRIVECRPLEAGTLTLGRQRTNMVVLDNPGVSRHHLRIDTAPGGAWHVLEDLGSLNGTFVNGQRVGACLLKAGDEVLLGQFLLKIRQD